MRFIKLIAVSILVALIVYASAKFILGIELLTFYRDPSARRTDQLQMIPPDDAQREEITIVGDLEIACPVAVVCDRNFDYRAYEFEGDGTRLYFSFAPTIVDGYSLSAFQQDFKYLTVNLYFPEFEVEGEVASFSELLRTDAEKVQFTRFENGRLQGKFEVYVDAITVRKNDRECMIQDAFPPDWCSRTIPYNTVVKGGFDLAVPKE